MLRAGTEELRQAFWYHVHFAGAADAPSSRLILFYAVECGMKAAWLRRKGMRHTDQIPDSLRLHGHDLRQWAKALHLPATLELPGQVRLSRSPGAESAGCAQVHEAWRYGIRLHEADEKALMNALQGLQAKVRQEVGR